MVSIAILNGLVGGGISRVVELQAGVLAKAGNKVVVISLTRQQSLMGGVEQRAIHQSLGFVGDRVILVTLPFNPYLMLEGALNLSKFDLSIAHTYPMTALASLASKLRQTRYVLYNHGIQDIHQGNLPWYEKAYLGALSFSYPRTIGSPDLAISISEWARGQLKRAVGLGSQVIYNPVDTTVFHPDIDQNVARARHGIGTSPVMLYVGRIDSHKGIEELLRIHGKVREKHPRTKLLLVGKARYGRFLNRVLAASSEAVKYVGWVQSNELPFYYASSDVYVTASFWEGFDLPAAEAQACGKPVVAFDVGAHREIVVDGVTGHLIRLGDTERFADAVSGLLASDHTRAEMGRQGHLHTSSKFSSRLFGRKTEDLVRSLAR